MPLVLPNAPGRTGTSNTPRNVAYDGKAMVKQQGGTFSGRHGVFQQIGVRPSPRQGNEQATVQACVAKVLGMIKAGQLPAPEANFKLTGVAYDPRFFNGPKGDVMAVEQVPEDGTPNSGKIIVFAPGAETMEKAVLCLAHELWRFNKAEGADGNKAFAYAQGAQRIYNGGTYVGPTPVYETGAEGDVKAEPQKETQANTPAETKPDTLGDMGDAIGNAASSALTAIGNALVPSANAAPASSSTQTPAAKPSGKILATYQGAPPTIASWDVDWTFIAAKEGGRRRDIYWPGTSKSGVTVATGVDLGRMRQAEFISYVGRNSTLFAKLSPYVSPDTQINQSSQSPLLIGQKAEALVKAYPLLLDEQEAIDLDEIMLTKKFIQLPVQYEQNKTTTTTFMNLPKPARTVMLSMAWNFGQNMLTRFSGWASIKAILRNDWPALIQELEGGKWNENIDRRAEEARYLKLLLNPPTPGKRP